MAEDDGLHRGVRLIALDFAEIQLQHQLRSRHRCSCGWEGDNAFTHVIDALGLKLDGWVCTYHPRGFCHNPLDCDLVPTFRVSGVKPRTPSEVRQLETLSNGK